jgi:hypothetical protein
MKTLNLTLTVAVAAPSTSPTFTERISNMPTKAKKLPPIHPGQVLKEVRDDAGITAKFAPVSCRAWPSDRSGLPSSWGSRWIS